MGKSVWKYIASNQQHSVISFLCHSITNYYYRGSKSIFLKYIRHHYKKMKTKGNYNNLFNKQKHGKPQLDFTILTLFVASFWGRLMFSSGCLWPDDYDDDVETQTITWYMRTINKSCKLQETKVVKTISYIFMDNSCVVKKICQDWFHAKKLMRLSPLETMVV